ncbi:hypothetical protein FDECE_17984 [Fusarium decemcellulare]|nr:hypothetical protein FDECE_17984 [Fusarium decemcellulare]
MLPPNGIAQVARFTHDRTREGQKIRSMDSSKMGQDFLSKALGLHQANPDKFPEAAIHTLCLTNFGAGSDTTSISLCAIIFFLTTHPESLFKVGTSSKAETVGGMLSNVELQLRNEIDAKLTELGNIDKIPFEDTQAMPYLQACVKESLRLHPATGLPLARVVPYGGVTVSGTFFPEGTVVGVNSWVAHHNTDVFGPDADEFRPERWLTEDKERLSMMEAYWIPASTNTPARSVGPSVQVVGR